MNLTVPVWVMQVMSLSLFLQSVAEVLVVGTEKAIGVAQVAASATYAVGQTAGCWWFGVVYALAAKDLDNLALAAWATTCPAGEPDFSVWSMAELKTAALAIGAEPVGDKRRKDTWAIALWNSL